MSTRSEAFDATMSKDVVVGQISSHWFVDSMSGNCGLIGCGRPPEEHALPSSHIAKIATLAEVADVELEVIRDCVNALERLANKQTRSRVLDYLSDRYTPEVGR